MVGRQSSWLYLPSLDTLLNVESHLEKTPIQYIQWRFQDGHDSELHTGDMLTGAQPSLLGEILEKATRVLSPEEKAQLETEFVGKNGQRRKLEV